MTTGKSDRGPKLLRPSRDDLERIDAEVGEVSDIQQVIHRRHPNIKVMDRAAHQYQIMGGRVCLKIAVALPSCLRGVGLFLPGVEHYGVARVSTSLGFPHPESKPDFLGLRASFVAGNRQQVDIIGVSGPTVPVDHHRESVDFLRSMAEAAGSAHLVDHPMTAANASLRGDLYKRMGKIQADKLLSRIAQDTAHAATFGTAYLPYWTGVLEVAGTLGKLVLRPIDAAVAHRSSYPGDYFLTRDWERRQAAGDIRFAVHWLRYLDDDRTPLLRLSEPWEEGHAERVGELIFPQTDLTSLESRLWASLAAEMDANPGNWIADAEGLVKDPSTELGLMRKLAYERSALGRNALRIDSYRNALLTGVMDEGLARELQRRAALKQSIRHVDKAPPRG